MSLMAVQLSGRCVSARLVNRAGALCDFEVSIMTVLKHVADAPAPSVRQFVGNDGIPITGTVWGDPADPLVILLHGGGQTRHAWGNTGGLLAAAGYHVVALDARGHGDSGWASEGSYEQNDMIEDLIRVIDTFGNPRCSLVGASMGGVTSLLAVGEGRVKVTAVVLVDIAPRVEPDGVRKIRNFMCQKPDGFDTLEDVAAAINSYLPHRKRAATAEGLKKNVRRTADGKFRWHWDPRILVTATNPLSRQLRMEAAASHLSVPALLVRGALSDVLSEEGAQEFLNLCPYCEYVNVTNAAHMVAGDENDVFATSIMEFLGRVAPASAGLSG
jgi:pimeloyl-ACP methyl ester carboxylesterase